MTGNTSRLMYLAVLAPIAALGSCAGEGERAETVGMEISRIYVAEPATGERTAMYATITNNGDAEDELIAVSTPAAGIAEIHRTVDDSGTMRMEKVESVTVPAGATVRLAPGGYHVMLMDLKDLLWAGDHIDVTLHFRRMGEIAVRPKVVEYSDLETVLDRSPEHDAH